MIRRQVVAAGSLVLVVVALLAVSVSVSVGHHDDDTGGFTHQMMFDGTIGRQGWDGPGGFHGHGAVVTTERSYLVEMVAHHEEAIASAGELRRSSRPEMRAFGRSVVASQSAQVRQMRAWLSRWYPGADEAADYEPMMRDLSGLEGDALDRAFLEDMVRHHMTAVMMSQHLLARGLVEHEEVAVLARSVRDVQHREIFWMQDRLAEWFGRR